jgi:hypothetical protein
MREKLIMQEGYKIIDTARAFIFSEIRKSDDIHDYSSSEFIALCINVPANVVTQIILSAICKPKIPYELKMDARNNMIRDSVKIIMDSAEMMETVFKDMNNRR